MAEIEEYNSPSVSLRDFIEQKFDAVEEQFEQHRREHSAHDRAHEREHEDSQKAIDTAATLQKETKKDQNEWRQTMDDRERTLATKTDINTLTAAVNELKAADIKRAEAERQRLINETQDIATAKDRQSASQWRIGLVVGTAAILGSVLINLALRLLPAIGA